MDWLGDRRDKMVSRVYKGIPDSMRGFAWKLLLDIDRKKEEQRGRYKEMRSLARRFSPDIRQIDLDVNRTYRDHIDFRERYGERQVMLFHVLAAYSVYNTEIGYCQGMSQIAALLLMYLHDEEDTFWGLSQLMVMNKYAMHGFFIQGFPRLLRFQAHHDRILKKYLPKLKKHLDKNGIDTGIYTLKWFFQCFLDRIPFSLTLRIWDLYILEGERIMTVMAYNILRMHRRFLMRLGCDELIEHLQINLEKDFGYTDDDVVKELSEALSDLGSKRMDTAGRPNDDELPKSPFGLAAQQMAQLGVKSAGMRTGLTEKEREISANAIQRHVETEERVSRLRAQHSTLDEEDEEDGGSDVSLNETQSIPGGTLDTSGGGASSSHRTSAQFHNTSSGGGGDNSSSRTNSRHAHSAGANSSEAIQRLDESVRMMMTEATNINGGNGIGGDDDDDVIDGGKAVKSAKDPKRYSSQSYTAASSSSLKKKVSKKSKNNGVLSSSVQEVNRRTVINKSDVVRINVSYQPDDVVTVSNSTNNSVVEGGGSPNKRGGAESR